MGLLAAAIAALTLPGVAQERDRAQIADRYKWNLTEIYPTADAWRAAKERVQKELPKIGAFKGKLASSPATLAEALDTLYAIDKELSRAFVYVGLLADQDTRESGPQGMREEMVQLGAAFSAESSYIEPEILKVPKATLEKFIASEPRLKVHRFYIEDIARRATHTLSDSEERILAAAGPLAGAPSNVYNILSNADFPYPSVTLSDGKTAKLDAAAFSVLRGLPNRGDRQKVMSVVLPVARELQPHVRDDDERRCPEGAVLREGAGSIRRRWRWCSTARTSRRRCTRGSSTASTARCRRSIAT